MKKSLLLFLSISYCLFSCKQAQEETPVIKNEPIVWQAYDETEDLAGTQQLENPRMHLKLINSKVRDKNEIWKPVQGILQGFSIARYKELLPQILEKDIPTLQQSIKNGIFTYEELTLFYLYRIASIESDNDRALNGVIVLNSNAVAKAREYDQVDKNQIDTYSVFGMPILLKDNIGTAGMNTTAGAIALQDNQTGNAFITERLEAENAVILGKANLSEWAYFLCTGCPVGYSAVGGQTINPYGRLQFESGGSSSGSGVSVAANYAVAAIGTETAGSILSPSSQNSVVGLKPTIGALSRTGIVPISSTLDTPGPMTKNTIDNSIIYHALVGKDLADSKSVTLPTFNASEVTKGSVNGKRFGVIKSYFADTLYAKAIDKIKANGGEIIEIEPERVNLPGFLTVLNIDMKKDLPEYIEKHAGTSVTIKNIEDAVAFNKKDTLLHVPYGQQLFEGILADTTTDQELEKIKNNLETISRAYFDVFLDDYELDAFLSINNYHAAYAAMAKYPALTVPMGYTEDGEPEGLTFIGKPFTEMDLLQLGYGYEQISKERKLPKGYEE
ncbi:amidase [Dokdonia pacifica]|uniref:Amidase n=1 Tax=Dokdonia pacifica TaxID=1627892 RepID=A0A239BDQ4_9FLAO|nr:amidase family protein [Dokdonia pacifica]GGG30286.1 amidase [Dokdonia pacifica]SNS05173.1 amidase [Dokdonia pacifica]